MLPPPVPSGAPEYTSPEQEEDGMRQVQMNGAAPAESATVPAVKPKRGKKAARPKRKQGPRHCGRCGSANHDTRTCSVVAAEIAASDRARGASVVVHRDIKPAKEPAGLTEAIERLAEKLLRLAVDRAIEKVERALAK